MQWFVENRNFNDSVNESIGSQKIPENPGVNRGPETADQHVDLAPLSVQKRPRPWTKKCLPSQIQSAV
jgi:hypothetical protein